MLMTRRIGLTVVVAALAFAGSQVVTATPAAAVPGLVRVFGIPTPDDNRADKTTLAECPASSPRIVGGGILINDHGQRQAFAQFMRPFKNSGGRDVYVVAATTPPGFDGTYSLQAIAVCASNSGVPGHEVLDGTPTNPSSTSAQETAVRCSSSGKRVIGFGGGVLEGGRQVGLQTIRSSGPRDISRAYAREHATGYSGPWRVRAFVICMTTNDNRPPSGAPVPGSTATTLCSTNPNTFVHGLGGGAWDGIGLIHRIEPSANLRQNTVVITPGSTAAFTSTICIP